MIRNVIPQRLDIGTGFIITSTGKVSTQCDLIVYDKNNCPLIENGNKQRFFPIECIVAIGEIKSDLDKEKLKEALLKLKNNKLLRNEIPQNNSYIFKNSNLIGGGFNPKNNINDEIITFLICNKLNFNYDNLVNEMNNIYDNCEVYLRHNMILSINDGTLMYKGFPQKNQLACYPQIINKTLINSLVKPYKGENPYAEYKSWNIRCYKYVHIVAFLNYIYMGTSTTSILYPEMSNYLAETRLNEFIDEKEN